MNSPKNVEAKSVVLRRKCGGNTESVPVLYYFDVSGLAEPIRFCFAYGNIDFVDVRIPVDKWATCYKALSPSGTAPWLEVDGEQFAESQAILQYAARRSGLIPQSTEAYIQAMTVLEATEAIRTFYAKLREELAHSQTDPKDVSARTSATIKFIEEGKALKLLEPLDLLLAKTQDHDGHIVGGELSFIDMQIAAYTRSLCDMVEGHSSLIQESLPHMYRTMELVYSLPSIQKWVLHHSSTPDLYCDLQSVEGRMVRIALSLAGVKYDFKGSSEKPRINIKGEDVATGLRPCFLWINARYNLMPLKSNINILSMWSLIDLIRNMAITWGTSKEAETATLKRVNQLIMKSQTKEGLCVGHTLCFADVAAAAFYEFYMSGHSVGVESSDIAGFRNAYRLVYQIPAVSGDMLKYDPVPNLVYFNIPGKGEAIRFLCHATNYKFNDVRVSLVNWADSEFKKQSPTGKLPYMQIGDMTLAEQSAIITYLAGRCDLLPITAAGRYQAHTIESASHDLTPIIAEVFRAKTKEEKTTILREGLIDFLSMMEGLVKLYKPANSLPQYLVEDRLTYIDFMIAGMMAGFPEELNLDMTQWSSLKAIYDHVIALPQVFKYREERGPLESILFDGGERVGGQNPAEKHE